MAEKGSLLMYSLLCEESHENCWYSQPLLQGMASGNLSMTNSILLSRDTFEKIRAMMDTANVNFFSGTTYNSLQD